MHTANSFSPSLSLLAGKMRRHWARVVLMLSVLMAAGFLFGYSLTEARQNDVATGATLALWNVALPTGATITVNDSGEAVANDGKCTLREAIIAANTNLTSGAMLGECVAGTAGADTIVFNLGAGTPTINLALALPIITEPITIKGNSGGATRVELNGASAGGSADGLRLTAGNSAILRLVINRFSGNGILISGTGFNTVKGCLIGTNALGMASSANGTGIRILGSSNNFIGGTAAGERNLISGNTGAGVVIAYDSPNTLAASGNKVIGNFIGADANGKLAIGNGGFGVDIVGGDSSTIGGVTAEARNIISGNNGGIGISTSSATGNVITGNYIGTDISSLAPLGNNGAGVSIDGSPNNRVGGLGVPCPADNTQTCSEGNTIKFNALQGVVVKMNAAIGNSILGNSISENTGLGIDLGGDGFIPNTVPGAPTGVSATAGNSQATVSFTPPASDGGNVIYAYTVTSSPGGITKAGLSSPITVTGLSNGTAYTFTVTATNIIGAGAPSVPSNSVTPTAAPPFAEPNSATSNDLLAPENIGANNQQNSPVLSLVTVGSNSSAINGTLHSSGSTTFRIEFFINPLCDPSGKGEGGAFIGSTNVTTSPVVLNDSNSGMATFSKALDYPLPGGLFVTATATKLDGSNNPVETSEFSTCAAIPFTSGGCHYIVNPGVMSFSAAAASTTFNVTAEFLCGWTATSMADWISITSGGSGTGNGTVALSIATNPGAFRFGTVKIAGTDFTISQDASCLISVTPGILSFSAQATTSTVTLSTAAECAWNVVNATTPWVTVTTQASGSGPTFIDLTAEANPGPSQRVGLITVAGQSLIVTQDAPCTAAITPTSKTFTATAGTGTFDLTVGAACSWTVEVSDPWITLTSANTSGSGNATFSYSVAANTGGQRTGNISVAGKSLVISQDGACSSMIDPTSQSFMPPGGNGSIAVTIGATCAWQATTETPWISITSGASGTGNGTVNFTVQANTGVERSGTITVAGQSFLVQQTSPCAFTLSPSFQSFVVAGGTGSTSVTVAAGCAWTATASDPWITITSGASGTGNGTVNYTVATNGTGGTRAGQISVGDKTLSITQEGGCTYTVTPTSQSFVAAGGMNSATVTTSASCSWTAISNVAWITVTSGGSLTKPGQSSLGRNSKNGVNSTGNGTVNYTVAANTGPMRTGTMDIAGTVFTVTQASGCPISISPANLPNATLGVNYSQQLTQSGGIGTINWTISAGSLPVGMMLDQTSGMLLGAPSLAGNFSFTARATDSNSCYGETSYTLVICSPITVNPVTLPGGVVGGSYSQSLMAVGGNSPHSFSFSGTLPNGLTLANNGLLSGIPTQTGTFNFAVMATDTSSCTGSRSYTVTINPAGLMFYPLPRPIRLLDTRAGATGCDLPGQAIPGGTSRTQTAAGRTCDGITIPASARALTGNITTVGSGGGYLTLYPSDVTRPTVANSNYQPNEILNNVFTVGLGAGDGAFKIFVTSNTHLVVDVTGYYAPPGAGGLYFHPLPSPIRLLETRPGQSGCETTGTPLIGGAVRSQQARITCAGVTIPANAAAIVGNATVVNPGALGYLTLYPGNAARPLIASSNFGMGQLMNAPFTAGLSPDGAFNIYSTTITDLVVDVLGYYSPDAVDVNGNGLLFNPLPRPVRLLETRNGFNGCYAPGAPLAAGSTRTQQARGVCDGVTVPTTAQAIVGNATVVAPGGNGHLTFWPSNVAKPLVANSNYLTGQVFNRHFTVGLGADGAFNIFTLAATELVIDISGYFAP